MPIKLGATNVTLKLGSQSVTARLGSTLVSGATVPAAPTITLAASGLPIEWTTPSDGGSALLQYKVYLWGELDEVDTWKTFSNNTYGDGAEVEVSAINAVGEGPRSSMVVVEP